MVWIDERWVFKERNGYFVMEEMQLFHPKHPKANLQSFSQKVDEFLWVNLLVLIHTFRGTKQVNNLVVPEFLASG